MTGLIRKLLSYEKQRLGRIIEELPKINLYTKNNQQANKLNWIMFSFIPQLNVLHRTYKTFNILYLLFDLSSLFLTNCPLYRNNFNSVNPLWSI